MKRYFTKAPRPKAYVDEGEFEYHERATPISCIVHEPEEDSVFSGILNAEGDPLYRRAKAPIGFMRRDEE